MYLHAPDRTTPFEETLAAINEDTRKEDLRGYIIICFIVSLSRKND